MLANPPYGKSWKGDLDRLNYGGSKQDITDPRFVINHAGDPQYSLITRSSDGQLLFLVNRTPIFAKEAERWSYGITSDMWSLRPEHFKVISSVLPPSEEQAAIVRFLDHANRKIDGFIRNKRKLIGLLNEQKQAIIHGAVTRGLNPDAKLKPSGIPWLGDIPEHWGITPLKGVCLIQSGITLGKTYAEKQLSEFPYLRVANVQAGHLSLTQVKSVRPELALEIDPVVTAITRTEREIALMQEYRTRLTADILTGKLDVREAAARLPDLPADTAADPTDDGLDMADIADDAEIEED